MLINPLGVLCVDCGGSEGFQNFKCECLIYGHTISDVPVLILHFYPVVLLPSVTGV